MTGALRDLLIWWQRVGTAAAPRLGDLDAVGSAPDSTDSSTAVLAGVAAAERAVDAGATLLVPRTAPRSPRAARIVVALLTRAEPAAVLPQLAGMTDRAWARECAAIRDGLLGVIDVRSEPLAALDRLGGTGIAHTVGVLLAAAARRTPCLVDGTDELAAALVADRLSFRAKSWWRLAATSSDPARRAAVERLDLAGGLALDLSDESGRGAQATLAVLLALLEPGRGQVD